MQQYRKKPVVIEAVLLAEDLIDDAMLAAAPSEGKP